MPTRNGRLLVESGVSRGGGAVVKIGIIGTGNMGSGLARQLTAAGHDVFVGSRDEAKGTSMGEDMGA
jgi:prephenate dehydrogenase